VSDEVVVTLTDSTWEREVGASAEPYLVDFWADWCTPCLALAPIVDEVAAEHRGQVRVGRLNIIEEAGIAERCGIKTVPTMIVFKGGEVVKRIHGARGKRQLLLELEDFLH
jgi:thioredoxin 1